MTDLQTLAKTIQSTTINCVATIAANKEIDFDSKVLGDKLIATREEWVMKIINEAKSDASKADIMDNLKRNKIDPLVKHAFSVAITHGCTMYANFLLGLA